MRPETGPPAYKRALGAPRLTLPQGEQGRVQFGRGGGDRGAAGGVVVLHEFAAAGVGDTIHVPVEHPGGDEAQIEGAGAKGAELSPARRRRRRAAHTDDRLTDRRAPRRLQAPAVAPRATATRRPV